MRRAVLPEIAWCVPLIVPGVMLARNLARVGWNCAAVFNVFDVRLVSYLLEWGYRYVRGIGLSDSIWSPPFFFPEPNVLAYSDTYFSAYPFYFPARFVGLGPQEALLFFQMSQLFLTPLVTYGCARWLGLGRLASFVCAFTFGWGWARFFQYGHIQFSAGWIVPLFFTFMFHGIVERRARWSITALWTLVFAYYLAVYYAYFLLLLAAPFSVVALVAGRKSPQRDRFDVREPRASQLALGALATLVPVGLLACGTRHYLAAARVLGGGSPSDALTYRASLWSWLRPNPGNLLWGHFAHAVPQDAVAPWEKNTFIGWVALALCLATPVVAWRHRPFRDWLARRRAHTVGLLCAAIAVPLTVILLSDMPPPFDFLETPAALAREFLPGFGAIRASARICLVLSFLSSLVGATWVDFWSGVANVPLRAGLVLALVLAAENATPIPPVADRCASDRSWLAIQPEVCALAKRTGAGTIAFLPAELNSVERSFAQVPAMTLALGCGLRTINGYTGYAPPWLAPVSNADPAVFPCHAFASLVDAAETASHRSTMVWVEREGPLGPPAYSLERVTECLSPCTNASPPVRLTAGDRAGEVVVTDGTKRCSTR